MIKRKLYFEKINKFIDEEEVKVICGVRRCGKTVFLKQIIEELITKYNVNSENIFYFSLESAQYSKIKNYQDLNDYIFKKTKNIKGKIYLFFDEIQMIENWERSINAYRIDLDADIYITGSNSKLLSGELSSLLSGRFIKIEMYPFSFNEVISYYNERNIKIHEDKLFNHYLKYGGLPRVLNFEEEEKIAYLEDIYSTIVLKDIILRNNIRDVNFLEHLIKFMIVNSGHLFSINSIRKYLKHDNISVSTNTIGNYLNYMVDAYILLKAPREEIKTKKILSSNEKYYSIDSGFYEIQSGIQKSRGQLIENIVYLELIRRNYKVTVGNINKVEVDFVCKKNNIIKYIQVSETIMDETTRKHEFNSLKQIKDNYPKYILTLDNWDYSKDGIKHINIIDFLKNEEL